MFESEITFYQSSIKQPRFGINLKYLELPCDLITVDVLNELAQVSCDWSAGHNTHL